MVGDPSGEDTFVPLSRRSAPGPGWRGPTRRRIGPLRTVADVADHPVLSGIRSGAVSGLIIVAVLSLPVLLILSAKAPPPATFEPEARVWASVETEGPVRVPTRPMPAPATVAAASPVPDPAPEPSRARVGAERTPLSLDLLPVLDDASGVLPPDGPPLPDTRPTRPSRPAAQRAARTP